MSRLTLTTTLLLTALWGSSALAQQIADIPRAATLVVAHQAEAPIRVAGLMGIGTVRTMSSLPAGRAGDLMPKWVVSSRPPETQDILRYQREEGLLPFWTDIAALAQENGVERIALDLRGNQCAYNVPSLGKLRGLVGPVIGANLDPSHLFWMGADPLLTAEALGEAIHHVHAKDTLLNAPRQATTGCWKTAAFWTFPPEAGAISPWASAMARKGGAGSAIG